MRAIANKKMDEEAIIRAAKTLVCQGVNRLKLYFVTGLLGETSKDIEEMADLIKKITEIGYRPKTIHLNVNPLIAKPRTPFQWKRSPFVSYVRKSLNTLKRRLKGDARFAIRCLDPRRAKIKPSSASAIEELVGSLTL